ncbi:MAG: hypothetical protein KDM64_11860, partial [Verrucomicrobiae bacterium]|nr:hypothetical protein [Verrucomicrobiae bacterium]
MDSLPVTNRERLTEVSRLLSEAEAKSTTQTSKINQSPNEEAAQIDTQATLASLRSEQQMLEQESLSRDLRRDLLEARRDLAQSDLDLARESISELESRTQSLMSARISEAEQLLGDQDLEKISHNTLVSQLLSETKELALKNQDILSEIGRGETALRGAESELDRVRRDYENIRTQIEIGGLEDSFAQIILELRSDLPEASEFKARNAERRKKISEARLDAFHLSRELDDASTTSDELEKIIASLRVSGIKDEVLERAKSSLTTMLNTRNRLKKDAADGSRKLARQLSEVELVENETLSMADDVRDYLGEKLIWVASSPPMNLASFQDFGSAFAFTFGPKAMRQYREALSNLSFSLWLLFVCVMVALLLPRRRLRHFLAQSALKTRHISSDGIGNTMGALSASVLLSLPLPFALLFLGWAFAADSGGSNAVFAMSKGLMAAILLLFALRLSAFLCRPKGVAEAHFRWSRSLLDACQRSANSLILVYLPPLVLLTAWFNSDNPSLFQGPGRIVFISSMLATSFVLWRLLRLGGGMMTHFESKPSWWFRLRHIWVPLVILIPISLAVLAAIGHFLTAVALAYQVQNTNLIILIGIVTYGLLTRWVMLKERRIALTALREQREAKSLTSAESEERLLETPATRSATNIGGEEEEEDDEDQLDLETVGRQTRRLIGSVVTVTVLLACWILWVEVFPVLKYLDKGFVFGGVSIADLISLALIGIVASVVFQNLPGLLEMAFLQRLELDSGIRNAITTICQYLVIAVAA